MPETVLMETEPALNESKFKGMLADKLNETKDRNMFTGTEVHDLLLDLWLALNEDISNQN